MATDTEMHPLNNKDIVALAERENDPTAAYYHLLFGKKFTDEEKRKLLNIIQKSSEVSLLAIETLSWLSEKQRQTLRGKSI